MPTFRIANETFDLGPEIVEQAVTGVLPEPIHEDYVVVAGRRFPPKQVLARLTRLDRADFTTDQARRILRRLGFVAALTHAEEAEVADQRHGPHGGRQAAALAPYAGQWVALASPTEVLVGARTPQDVLRWLATHDRRADYGMFRVPAWRCDGEGAASS